jgi:hypothetical protein
MRRRFVAVMLSTALTACVEEPAKKRGAPGEDFTWDDSVRVTAPTNGETVGGTFVVELTAGKDLSEVRLDVDGALVDTLTATDLTGGVGTITVTAEPGRHTLLLSGLDDAGDVRSEHSLVVRVADDETPWITVTSPADGATVSNPVSFTVSTSFDVDQVEILADDWTLGTMAPSGVLSYEFAGTGFARAIEARAYDDGVLVAQDFLTITVEDHVDPGESDVNDLVMSLVDQYPTDGSYDYWWPSGVSWSGNPHDIWYLDQLFAEGDPQHRSFCVGLTFEVFMRAFDEADRAWGGDGSLNGVPFDELYELRTDWYVRDLWGSGPVEAVENYGIGAEVRSWDHVRPGDFVQFWRHSGSGHNVVFIDWERDSEDTIIGFRYWSTQGSTDGVGFNSEYFGSSGSRVDPNHFFVARVFTPDDWVPWR